MHKNYVDKTQKYYEGSKNQAQAVYIQYDSIHIKF